MSRTLYPRLLEPVTVAGLELRNRIVMSPMEVDFGSPEGHIWGAAAHRLIAGELAERARPLLPRIGGES